MLAYYVNCTMLCLSIYIVIYQSQVDKIGYSFKYDWVNEE